jgi:hypothetical protein
MATTTNYGWSTPDDTALVSQGAAAIRTLGSSVDTTVKALSPGTTAGDVDYYTSTTAKARLGIGSSGQVLTVSGGVPAWATSSSGGMTLLSTTTLSGATVTISSISQSYNSLMLVMYGVTAAGNGLMKVLPNANATGATFVNISCNATTISTTARNGDFIRLGDTGWDGTNSNNATTMIFNNYTSSTNYKPFISYGYARNSSGADSAWNLAGGFVSNTAISSLQFSQAGGNLSAGTVLLYGVK